MSDPKAKCLYCEQTMDEIPLVAIHYRDQQYWICPSHMPLLIHNPAELVGRLPGAEKLTPHP
ncbi:MAG: hypothetical protein IT308_05555 [Anaerolineaceae bacterium]|nr:hypothetical protein [Anaerolineaceae bacterium]